MPKTVYFTIVISHNVRGAVYVKKYSRLTLDEVGKVAKSDTGDVALIVYAGSRFAFAGKLEDYNTDCRPRLQKLVSEIGDRPSGKNTEISKRSV